MPERKQELDVNRMGGKGREPQYWRIIVRRVLVIELIRVHRQPRLRPQGIDMTISAGSRIGGDEVVSSLRIGSGRVLSQYEIGRAGRKFGPPGFSGPL